jgi:RsiW-degrading membrane proteinase PrsW (M82 family)
MSDQSIDIQQLAGLFLSIFQKANIWGVILAVVFGAICFACFRPSVLKKPWLWAVLVGGGILGVVALVFIQMPLQNWIGKAMLDLYGPDRLTATMLISGIPTLLISGLIQEGAKLVPVIVYWWRSNKKVDPRFGLIIGAAAGAGFGIMEAQWILSAIVNQGWNLDYTITYGWFVGISPLWERFFTIAFHVSATALAGYGLARGLGWQYYLMVSILHMVLNYSVILLTTKVFPVAGAEVYIAVWAMAIAAWALILRWQGAKKGK